MNFQTFRQEVLARVPGLEVLDRIEVSADELRGAKIDYLKRYLEEWHNKGGTYDESEDKILKSPSLDFLNEHPQYENYAKLLGLPSLVKKTSEALRAGMIRLDFHLFELAGGEPKHSIKGKTVTKSMSISQLKSLTRRLFKIGPRAPIELVGLSAKAPKMPLSISSDIDEIDFLGLENDDCIQVHLQCG
ncbi:hypothetical protein Ciccas_000641 [Cichlidogyrus casuarinus]|uniref:Uncharacterized protein n=1 Tax=Cichlidogyrus casuarinus TaxID=1844966 RepID=A0ABD2QMA3_9PLAT